MRVQDAWLKNDVEGRAMGCGETQNGEEEWGGTVKAKGMSPLGRVKCDR